MGTNVMGLLLEWNKILQDSRRNVVLLTFIMHLLPQIFVVKLLKDVCSDYTDTNCIIIS